VNARHNPRRRYRHTAFCDANALHQQSRRLHEIFVIQKRLAHAHENQIDAILGRRNLLIFEHCANLPHNLSRREVAFHPEQRR